MAGLGLCGGALSHSSGIWGRLWFSCGLAHCGGGSWLFFRGFLLVLAGFSARGEGGGGGGMAGRWAIIPWGFEIFLVFSDFLRS